MSSVIKSKSLGNSDPPQEPRARQLALDNIIVLSWALDLELWSEALERRSPKAGGFFAVIYDEGDARAWGRALRRATKEGKGT